MDAKTLRFFRRGELVSLGNVPPERTLLELLREDLGCTGTKEGCGEGDCGACTVVLAELAPEGGDRLRWRAVNSCIRLAHSVDGLAVFTVEDLAEGGRLHPAQEAMVACHGSQCGFCTPGFVMSLFGMYQNHVCRDRPVTRALAQEELSGNLCRCTGYRPILEAAQRMGELPPVRVDEAALRRKLLSLADERRWVPASAGTTDDRHPREGGHSAELRHSREGGNPAALRHSREGGNPAAYLAPETLQTLLEARARHPQAQVVAGCTDVGLWVTKQHRLFPQILDVTRARELRQVERYEHHIAIGAAVSLTDAFAALLEGRPQLRTFANRFAGLPVRNAGTLGGNVANGSPIGDSMPLLIALGAHIVLMSVRGHRQIALEDFYTGYRQTVLAPDEILAWILVPRPAAGERLRAYKVSKRFDDDISAVCLVVSMTVVDGIVTEVGIGAGGVAATPVRAVATEAALRRQPWSAATVRAAIETLRAEFSPISDMRASAAYRRTVLGNLLQRFWLESQGQRALTLDDPAVEEVFA